MQDHNFASLNMCLPNGKANDDDSQTLWPNAQNDSHVQILQCMFTTGWYSSITSSYQIYKVQRFLPHLEITAAYECGNRFRSPLSQLAMRAVHSIKIMFDHLDVGARISLRWQCAFPTGKQWWWKPDFVTKRPEWQSCPVTPMYVQHRLVEQLANLQCTEVLATIVHLTQHVTNVGTGSVHRCVSL